MPLVVSRMMGGMGNQMFQYSAGLCVARRLGAAHRLHLAQPAEATVRQFSLACFPLKSRFAAPWELPVSAWAAKRGWLERKAVQACERVVPRRFTVLTQTDTPLDDRLFSATGSVYLDGYWQSEAYFSDVSEEVRSLFTSWPTLSGEMRVVNSAIAGCSSVAVHVRRGDYVSNRQSSRSHGVCPTSYYASGVAEIARRRDDVTAFVFSDEPEWCRQHLELGCRTTFVEGSANHPDWEDMAVMSHCRDHVISNSSFSWWAAWLASAEDKIVVAPRRWFLDEARESRASTIVPPTWLRL
jgi:Glycosyl transferase family 11